MKKNKEPSVEEEEDATTVVLRRRNIQAVPPPAKNAPTLSSPYSFMRRSCTFVAESSLGLRKSASRTTSVGQTVGIRTSLKDSTAAATAPQKVVKDRRNLALQVRQKKDMLEETANGESGVNGRLEEGVGGGGRMSRLVGGLRAWSSTEDVRQSFMGALGRTVSVIKQKPVSRKVKQAFTPTTRPANSRLESIKTTQAKPNNIKTTTTTSTSTTASSRTTPSKVKSTKPVDQKTEKQPAKKTQGSKFQFGKAGAVKNKTSSHSPASAPAAAPAPGRTNARWFRHIQEAQEAYTARDGRNRRGHQHTPLQDPDDSTPPPSDPLRDVDDGVEVDGGEAADAAAEGAADKTQQGAKSSESSGRTEESPGSTSSAQPPASPETLAKKTELLRRKDLKIRQALEEKQQIIANILNIPYEDFESVVDMAGEPAVGNKEPKELVLAAMFQAKCLQESLNEALNLTEGDIVAARANEGRGASLPLYQAPMAKLMNISTTLSQQLSSLLNLVSERDDERERMRKELVASRERLHLLHMRQNSASSQTVGASTQVPSSTQPTASSPYTSRPSSFVSVASSVADHSDISLQHDTDEDATEVSKGSSAQQEAEAPDTREEPPQEDIEDSTGGSEPSDTKPEAEALGGMPEGEEEAKGREEASAT